MGVTRDAAYQEIPKKAFLARKEGKNVCVRLKPELHNPYDSHAVAFAIHQGGTITVDFACIKS